MEKDFAIFQWILPLAALPMLAGIAILLIAHAWRRHVRYRAVLAHGNAAEPRCGRCGYVIIRGSAFRCPECGGYLPDVGVLTPATIPPMRPLGAILMAVALVGPIAGLVAVFAGDWQPFGWQYSAWKARDVIAYGSPTPGARAQITVQAFGRGRWFGRRNEHAYLYSHQGVANNNWVSGSHLPLTVSATDAASSASPPVVTERVMLEFLARGGFDARAGATQELARELMKDATDFAQTRFPPDLTDVPRRAQLEGVRYEIPPGNRFLIALVLWLIGSLPVCRLVLRVHARRVAATRRATDDLLRRLQLCNPYAAAPPAPPAPPAAAAATVT